MQGPSIWRSAAWRSPSRPSTASSLLCGWQREKPPSRRCSVWGRDACHPLRHRRAVFPGVRRPGLGPARCRADRRRTPRQTQDGGGPAPRDRLGQDEERKDRGSNRDLLLSRHLTTDRTVPFPNASVWSLCRLRYSNSMYRLPRASKGAHCSGAICIQMSFPASEATGTTSPSCRSPTWS